MQLIKLDSTTDLSSHMNCCVYQYVDVHPFEIIISGSVGISFLKPVKKVRKSSSLPSIFTAYLWKNIFEKIVETGRVNHRRIFIVGKEDDLNKSGVIIRWVSKVKLWLNQAGTGHGVIQNKV